MSDLNALIDTIHDEQEARLLLSAAGFLRADWPFIEKLGGALSLVKSDLMRKKMHELQAKDRWFRNFLLHYEAYFKHFLSEQGALLGPHETPFCAAILQAPLVAFSRFNHALLTKRPRVAIVGSRQADHEALILTKKLSATLASRDITIVSGGAAGIDTEAHQGAVDASGSTIIVSGMACSFKDNALNYRWRNLKLYEQCIFYPYGPMSPQGKFMFVGRNLYIVALADAVVVVQGSPGSGTLHTAQFAKNLSVPMFAIPGQTDKELSYVPNMLIAKQDAEELVDFEHFADSLMTKSPKPLKSQQKVEEEKRLIPQRELPALLSLLKDKGKRATMDELIQWSGRSCASIQQEMLGFEMDGLVIRQGSQFVLRLN